VRLIEEAEEGTGVDRASVGVYGFTHAPAETNSPLFRKQAYQSYEVHKLADGTSVLVGFAPLEAAVKVEAGEEIVQFRLLADSRDEALTLVSVPLARLLWRRQHSTRDSAGLELRVGPA
jgi:hypothetical protein